MSCDDKKVGWDTVTSLGTSSGSTQTESYVIVLYGLCGYVFNYIIISAISLILSTWASSHFLESIQGICKRPT